MSKQRHSHADRRKHHVIYKTTCLVTGRYYIGMHSTDDLADGYIGSGKRLWQSIKKHGADQHRCEVLEHLPSREALKLREAELVNEELLEDKQCMNLTLGGGGGWSSAQCYAMWERPEHRKAHSEAIQKLWQDPEYSKKIAAHSSTRMKLTHAEGKLRYDGFAGREHTLETRQRTSASMKGKQTGEKNSSFGTKWMHNDEQTIKVPLADVQAHLELGYVLGRK